MQQLQNNSEQSFALLTNIHNLKVQRAKGLEESIIINMILSTRIQCSMEAVHQCSTHLQQGEEQ